MSTLENKEQLVKFHVNKVKFTLDYIPGELESEDQYSATNEKFDVCSFGHTREEAIANAKIQLQSVIMSDFSLFKKLTNK